MAFKDILLVLTSYPDPDPVSAVDEPIAFAVAVGARISAIACEIKFRAPPNIFGGVLLDAPAIAAAETKKSSTNTQNIFWPHFKVLRIKQVCFKIELWRIVCR